VRRIEQKGLGECQPQHHARLGVTWQRFARDAIDQCVEVAHMAQHACDNRMDQRAIRRRQTLCGGVERKLQWLTASQDGIEQT
jgi:hypothetical protein